MNDKRSFDAWGNIRSGASTGDPKGRYCASLGHKQDDESGLVYMRARYYEPTSGRFVTEDISRNGSNWFAYGIYCPTQRVDRSGKDSSLINHVFGDDGFGEQVWDQFRNCIKNGDLDEFADWLEENFRGLMNFYEGSSPGVMGRFQITMELDDLEMEALLSDVDEIGTGSYLQCEYIDSLVTGAESVSMTD